MICGCGFESPGFLRDRFSSRDLGELTAIGLLLRVRVPRCPCGFKSRPSHKKKLCCVRAPKHSMLHPGFEPGLPRPQRGVLTTRLMEPRPSGVRAPRIELGTYCVLSSRHDRLDQARGDGRARRSQRRGTGIETRVLHRASDPPLLGVVCGGKMRRGPSGNRTHDLSHPKRESCH